MKTGHIVKMPWLISKTPNVWADSLPPKHWHLSRQNQSCKGILRDATPLTLTMEVEVSTFEVQTAGENDGILTYSEGPNKPLFAIRNLYERPGLSLANTVLLEHAFLHICLHLVILWETKGPAASLSASCFNSTWMNFTSSQYPPCLYFWEYTFLWFLILNIGIFMHFPCQILRSLGPKTPPLATARLSRHSCWYWRLRQRVTGGSRQLFSDLGFFSWSFTVCSSVIWKIFTKKETYNSNF